MDTNLNVLNLVIILKEKSGGRVSRIFLDLRDTPVPLSLQPKRKPENFQSPKKMSANILFESS